MNAELQQATFEKYWQAALERWDDDATHRLFLDFASEKNLLMEAAARYRAVAEQHDVAPHMDAIRARAMTLLAQRPEPAEPNKLRRALLFLAVFLVAALFVQVMLDLVYRR